MKESKEIVLIDMDNTMVDFDSAALAQITSERRVEKTEFYIAQNYPEELRPSIEATYNAPGFFENLEPLPGLLEAWQVLIDNGYHPQVGSSPLSSNSTAVEGKIKWLDRIMVPEFGPNVVEEAIIDKKKWKYPGLVLIDDRPDAPRGINGHDVAEWEHILFGWKHLATVPMSSAVFRLISWHDTGELISILNYIEERK